MGKGNLAVTTREAREERHGPPKTGPYSGIGKNRNKYHAMGRRVDGKYFSSQAEADRYIQLISMQAIGVIQKLELQPLYPIIVNSILITNYRADFRYEVFDPQGRPGLVVEDVKGMITDAYHLKKKMVEAQYGFKIHEIPARKVADWAGRAPEAR
jgi:hypothetical protein